MTDQTIDLTGCKDGTVHLSSCRAVRGFPGCDCPKPMTDTNTSGADVLAVIDSVHAKLLEYTTEGGHPSSHEAEDYHDARAAVAALIEREAALVAKQSADAETILAWHERWNRWCEERRSLTAERDALTAEVKALREDAERYRWLRDGSAVAPKTDYPVAKLRKAGTTLFIHALDEAIDAARASAATGGGNE